MEQSLCDVVADIAQRFGSRSRIKLRGASVPEPWGNWLIAPSAGYLEADGCGPWAWREVEWVEVDPGDHGAAPIAAAFKHAGLTAEVVECVVRVACWGGGGRT